MKVRTPDGEVHDLPTPEAVRLKHPRDAVPVVKGDDNVETRPAPATKKAETRPAKTSTKKR